VLARSSGDFPVKIVAQRSMRGLPARGADALIQIQDEVELVVVVQQGVLRRFRCRRAQVNEL
jgi:hypothetical protein